MSSHLLKRRNFLALAAAPLLRGAPVPKIKDVSVIATAPAGSRLVVVKVQTDQRREQLFFEIALAAADAGKRRCGI